MPYLAGAVPIPALKVLGVVCTAAGVALAVWGREYLGRNWGMPLTVKENPELITSGPYAYARNPVLHGSIASPARLSARRLVVGRTACVVGCVSCVCLARGGAIDTQGISRDVPGL